MHRAACTDTQRQPVLTSTTNSGEAHLEDLAAAAAPDAL